MKRKSVTKARPTAPDEAAAAIAFWDRMGILGPLAALALPLLAGWLLGAFADFEFMSSRAVTPLQAFTMLGAMLFPCAAFVYAQGEWNRAQAHASRGWPTVPGLVQESRVDSKGTQYGRLYRLVLSYHYDLGHREAYDGDMAAFGPSWVKDREAIEALAQKYPVGAKVTVHYDPDDPKTAVLELSETMARQNDWRVWLFVTFPFALTVVVAIVNR
jgi:hypothetical protein